jgi:hypothetical protein
MNSIKIIITSVIFIMAVMNTYAQEDEYFTRAEEGSDIKTLGGETHHHGGFGALSFKATSFSNESVVLAGLRGGWIINRSVAIGLEGYGIIPSQKFDNVNSFNGDQSILLGGYGGLFIEPIFWSNEVLHLTLPISAGAGWLGYHDDFEVIGNQLIDDDIIWYVEPGANLEINVVKNFRIATGISYRFTEDLEMLNTESDAFNGMNYYLTLKFGRF